MSSNAIGLLPALHSCAYLVECTQWGVHVVCGLAFGRPPARDLPVRRRVCTRTGIDAGRRIVVGTSRWEPRRTWQVQWDVAALDVWWGYVGVCCTHHAWRLPCGWVWLLGYAAVVRRLCGNHLPEDIRPACLLDRRWWVRPWLCTGDYYYGPIVMVQCNAFDYAFAQLGHALSKQSREH